MNKLSVAIPVYNRAERVLDSFSLVMDDPRVNEIVLLDDYSHDYEKLYANLHRLTSPKLNLYRNDTNLKAFHNKAKVVSLCQNPWVVLLDSDNSIDSSYLDAFFVQPFHHPQILYCPSFAKPHFDFTSLSDMLLKAEDLYLLSQFAQDIDDPVIGANIWSALINCGNYIVHRDTYLSIYKNYLQYDDFVGEPYAADVAYFNVLWLKQGYSMKIIPGMEYNHPISPDAFSFFDIDQKNSAYRKILSIFIDYCNSLK